MRDEVHCKITRVGYWEWVVRKLKLADDKNNEDAVLADAGKEEIAELQAATREMRALRLR